MPAALAPEAREVRARRREIIVAVVRREPGLACRDILTRLEAIHAEGGWPAAPWNGARQEPYYCGLSQNLDAMRFNVRYRNGAAESRPLVAVEEMEKGKVWFHRKDAAHLAESFLPAGELADELVAIASDCGCEIVFGVTEDLERVIRMDVGRGILEERVDDSRWGGGWKAALLALLGVS